MGKQEESRVNRYAREVRDFEKLFRQRPVTVIGVLVFAALGMGLFFKWPDARAVGPEDFAKLIRSELHAQSGAAASTNLALDVVLTQYVDSSRVGEEHLVTTTFERGASDLANVMLQVGTNKYEAIYLQYSVSQNRFFLLKPQPPATEKDPKYLNPEGCTPGRGGVVSHAHGAFDCARSTVSTSGGKLVIIWALVPKLEGTRNLELLVRYNSGAHSNDGEFESKGTWTVTPAQ